MGKPVIGEVVVLLSRKPTFNPVNAVLRSSWLIL
jgi:hypothetical protein